MRRDSPNPVVLGWRIEHAVVTDTVAPPLRMLRQI